MHKRNKENILDKGYIEVVDTMGTDMSIVNAARISVNKHFHHLTLNVKDKDLLEHMVKNGHWTPFSHVAVQLNIKMPIFVTRQWFKSTVGFSRNEISRRYTSEEPEFYLPEYFNIKEHNVNYLLSDMDLHFQKSIRLYNKLIEEDVRPEQARIILPQSMYTEFVETGSLAAYARLYRLRIGEDVQFETREYAKAIDKVLIKAFPAAWKIIRKYIL